MKTKVVLFLILTFFVTSLHANNVQLAGTVNIISAGGGTVTMEVDLSWDNSWRDDYNWDAVWLFFKYKEGVDGAWQHAAINASTATVTGGDYTVMPATTASTVPGLFVYPSKERGGNTGTLKVQVQWASSYTKAQFDNNDVFVVCHGIEMVYIPYGAYALGDGSSNGAFAHEMETKFYGPIPESSDVVDNNSGYTITASNEYTNPPSYINVAINAADNQNCSVYPTGSWYAYPGKTNVWWKIDFKTQKTIRYFGVSGATSDPTYAPEGIWYLEGSNDNANWTTLSTVSPNLWSLTSISYPVQQSIAVMNPGAYRYYRIYMPICNYPIVQNIAMTEDSLYDVADKYDIIDSENGRNFTAGNSALSVPAVYPKGYQGFYVMKYETSQEQYVEFLNSLTLAQQTALIPGVDSLNAGDFVFGSNKTAPNYRNGVVLASKQTGKPLMFDNNLNNNKQYSEDADGGTLAMNYMSISDAQGYASWAGLRPMTELEYEKACRRPYPQVPDAGEYAWNSATGAVNAGGLTMQGSGREVAASGNVNAGNAIQGPVRCGIFARPNTATQTAAGATYWGVMEMSGNVSELCANITHTTISKTGNGTGAYNATLFGSTPSTYGTRGGGFSDTHTTLATSDRSAVSRFTNVLQRDSSVGFRCAYTYGAAGSIDAGTLNDLSSICPNTTAIISGTPASASDVKITGYIWSVNDGSGFVVIPGAAGATLAYSNFVAGKTYTFKRKAICPLGEKEVTTSSVMALTPVTISVQPTDQIASCGLTLKLTATGSATVTYQWMKDGVSVSGATAATYTKASITASDSGFYHCVVSNTCGSENSATVKVTVDNNNLNTMTDPRDGKTYQIRMMADGRCWMVENLRFGSCSNGSTYHGNQTSNAANIIASGYYGVCMASPVAGGGHLYNWQAAMNSAAAKHEGGNPSGNRNGNSPNQWRGICPPGWHLPSGGSTGELQKLYTALCSRIDRFYPGTDDFRGVLCGWTKDGKMFPGSGFCWSSTYHSDLNAYDCSYDSSHVAPQANTRKYIGLAVRCVKNY